jgi:hypothetical protein
MNNAPRLNFYLEDAAAVDDLFRQAIKAKGDAALPEFLRFLARFPRYSLFNALLIRVQRPGAMAIASRRQWREQFQRSIMADAVPILILQPFGPVQFVYEVGDTYGAQMPSNETWNLFKTSGSLPQGSWDKAVAGAEASGIGIESIGQYGVNLAGTAAAVHAASDSREVMNGAGKQQFRIKINGRLEMPQRFAALTHELGHIYCGHLGSGAKARWPDRSAQLTSGQKELEAEAVSWLVCQRLGLDIQAAEYLSGHVSEGDLKDISIYAVTAAAHRIEARGSAR